MPKEGEKSRPGEGRLVQPDVTRKAHSVGQVQSQTGKQGSGTGWHGTWPGPGRAAMLRRQGLTISWLGHYKQERRVQNLQGNVQFLEFWP